MRKRWSDSHNCWCGAKNKWKGTKYYHGVTASQSRFQYISKSRKAVTIVIQLYLLLCKWDAQHDNSFKAMVMQVAATDHFFPIILSGWFFGCRAFPSSAIIRQRLQPTEVVQGLQEGASCLGDLPGDRPVHQDRWGGCGRTRAQQQDHCLLLYTQRKGCSTRILQQTTLVPISAPSVALWRTFCCLQHIPAWPVWWWLSDGLERHLWRTAHTTIRASDPLSDWTLAPSWCRTAPHQCASSPWMTKLVDASSHRRI